MATQSRFQFNNAGQKNKESCDQFPSNPKNVAEVVEFNSTGTFYVAATVDDLKFQIYKACPLRKDGMLCGRKLTENNNCAHCMHEAKQPFYSIYVRIEMRDLKNPEVTQIATLFSAAAQSFLEMKVMDMLSMDGKELDQKIATKIGANFVFKVIIKEKCGEYAGMDWRIASFAMMINEGKNEEAESKKQDEILIDEA